MRDREGGKEGKRENIHTQFCCFCQHMFYFFHVQLLEASRAYGVELLECHLEAVSPLLLLPLHLKYYCDGVEVGVWRCDAVVGGCGDGKVLVGGASSESVHGGVS